MKAEISQGSSTVILRLVPENEVDRQLLPVLAKQMARGYLISPRRFDYMSPNLEFYAQPMPRSD